MAALLGLTSATARGQGIYAPGFIYYQATQLADPNPGEQMWEYSYSIGGFTFLANQGFTIYFDTTDYKLLQNPFPSSSPMWSTLVVQPDLILNDSGFFDSQALVDSPSTSQQFKVDFIWLGTGTPGAQPFNTYNTDFSPAFSGSTAVPEPRAWQLLGMAGAAFLLFRRFSRFGKTIRSCQ